MKVNRNEKLLTIISLFKYCLRWHLHSKSDLLKQSKLLTQHNIIFVEQRQGDRGIPIYQA